MLNEQDQKPISFSDLIGQVPTILANSAEELVCIVSEKAFRIMCEQEQIYQRTIDMRLQLARGIKHRKALTLRLDLRAVVCDISNQMAQHSSDNFLGCHQGLKIYLM